MILLDAPYVSDFLKESVASLKLPVLDTPTARSLMVDRHITYADEAELARCLEAGQRVYTNSENSLDLIIKKAGDSDLARQIEICKDKALFRETIAANHPDYFFKRVNSDALDDMDVSGIPFPFVIKPARGFFSLGVHMVFSPEEWPDVVKDIRKEREELNAHYPEEVVDSGEFIIEVAIDGDEYAIDLYYDSEGEPVITNILFHEFADAEDVSDRLYYTSADIIRARLEPFTEYTRKIGQSCDFRNFPMHLEVRVNDQGTIVPIEANPLRFAGWCVADITDHAWGINPYEYYFENKRPDWPALVEERADTVCAMVIGDVPQEIDREKIESVEYDGFCDYFDEVLELRRIDYTAYPVFAFAFVRTTTDNLDSLKTILQADFNRFISTRT